MGILQVILKHIQFMTMLWSGGKVIVAEVILFC